MWFDWDSHSSSIEWIFKTVLCSTAEHDNLSWCRIAWSFFLREDVFEPYEAHGACSPWHIASYVLISRGACALICALSDDCNRNVQKTLSNCSICSSLGWARAVARAGFASSSCCSRDFYSSSPCGYLQHGALFVMAFDISS